MVQYSIIAETSITRTERILSAYISDYFLLIHYKVS